MAVDFSKLPDVSKEHPDLAPDEQVFLAHMKAREDAFFRVFGDTAPKNEMLSPGDPDLMDNWPAGGIYKYAPRKGRTGWHYVTHGLAQPFVVPEDEDDEPLPGEQRISGFGIELVVSTPQECDWAPQLLLNFVRYLLFEKEATVFLPGDRIPCAAFVEIEAKTKVSHLLCVQSPEYESEILLPAGSCTLVHLVGTTTAEIARAKSLGPDGPGSEVLFSVLLALGISPVTDLKRRCATSNPRFDKTWDRVQKKRG